MENLDKAKEIEVKDEITILPRTEVKTYTDEQIQAHAGKCGGMRNLKEVPIYTDDNHTFWYLVKRPSKNVLQAIAEAKEKGDKKNDSSAITDIQKLMMGCVLEGDKEAYEHDGSIYITLCKEIGKMSQESRSTLKNL